MSRASTTKTFSLQLLSAWVWLTVSLFSLFVFLSFDLANLVRFFVNHGAFVVFCKLLYRNPCGLLYLLMSFLSSTLLQCIVAMNSIRSSCDMLRRSHSFEVSFNLVMYEVNCSPWLGFRFVVHFFV